MENTPNTNEPPKDKPKMVGVLMMEAGTEFVFLIAGPLIAGILGGQWLDRKFNHHFFVIIGILAGLVISSVSIYKRIMDYKRMLK